MLIKCINLKIEIEKLLPAIMPNLFFKVILLLLNKMLYIHANIALLHVIFIFDNYFIDKSTHSTP